MSGNTIYRIGEHTLGDMAVQRVDDDGDFGCRHVMGRFVVYARGRKSKGLLNLRIAGKMGERNWK
jgi:hypothetical protein